MNASVWIFGAVVIISIIGSIWQGLRKQNEVAPHNSSTDEENDDIIVDEVVEKQVVEEGAANHFHPVSTLSVTEPHEEDVAETLTETSETNIDIDLTDADEARRAFIASEIFNKKY